MHKLVILFEPFSNVAFFEAQWPNFLHISEQMPGLRRETTSFVERTLFGQGRYVPVHELFFDTLAEAEQAMGSAQGQAAGRLLQQMTGGRMTLFFAEHHEDELVNIQKYRPGNGETG